LKNRGQKSGNKNILLLLYSLLSDFAYT